MATDHSSAANDVRGVRGSARDNFAFATPTRHPRAIRTAKCTHYLEEADANADRIVLIAGGQIVADGPPTEIKAKVGSRSIRATLPGADLARLGALPGVLRAERHGDAITLSCSDTDAALSALLASFPGTRDVEVRGASLEEAFLQPTVDEDDQGHRDAMGEPSGSSGEESR
jgi:hypothetical protein